MKLRLHIREISRVPLKVFETAEDIENEWASGFPERVVKHLSELFSRQVFT